jgi:signal transduction histidine kinase
VEGTSSTPPTTSSAAAPASGDKAAAASAPSSRTATIALYLFGAAVLVRTLVANTDRSLLPWYLALEAAFLVLYTMVWRRPGLRPWALHVAFACQSLIVVTLLALTPTLDFIPTLFVLLSYQAALVITGRARWLWLLLFVLLTALPLMWFLGPLTGLAKALLPMAGEILLFAYVGVSEDIEEARAESEATIAELEATQQQLRESIDQVEDLAAVEERNRLARELHDSVSQTMFSILLTTRSAQMLQQRDPAKLREQLTELNGLTKDALAQMRGLIAELRPRSDGADASD